MADYSFDQNLSGSVISDVSLEGRNDMSITLAGGTTTTLAGENTIHSDTKIAVEPVTLNPLTTTATITLEPVNSTIDLRPVAVDSCVRLELAPLPPTEL